MTTEQKISELEKQIGQLKAQLKDEQVNSVYRFKFHYSNGSTNQGNILKSLFQ